MHNFHCQTLQFTSFPFQTLLASLQRKEASDVHFKHKHVQQKQYVGQLYL